MYIQPNVERFESSDTILTKKTRDPAVGSQCDLSRNVVPSCPVYEAMGRPPDSFIAKKNRAAKVVVTTLCTASNIGGDGGAAL